MDILKANWTEFEQAEEGLCFYLLRSYGNFVKSFTRKKTFNFAKWLDCSWHVSCTVHWVLGDEYMYIYCERSGLYVHWDDVQHNLSDTAQRRVNKIRPTPGQDLLADRFVDDVGWANGNSGEIQSVQWIIRGLHIHHDRTFGELVPCPHDEKAGGCDAHY